VKTPAQCEMQAEGVEGMQFATFRFVAGRVY
jgi:hypothetical protein